EGENPACQTSLSCMGEYLPFEAEPLTNDLGGLFENFREVTAAFTLDQNGGGNDFYVLDRYPGDEIVECGFQFETVVHFVESEPKLSANGVGAFARNKA